MLASHLNMFISKVFFCFSLLFFPCWWSCHSLCVKGRAREARGDRRAEAACGSLPQGWRKVRLKQGERGLVVRAFAACPSRSPGGCCLPVLGGRRPLAVGVGLCPCSLWLPYTWVLPAVRCVSMGWVTGSCHFCVRSPAARAEVKGGSVLTSPCQNPVESSGMRAGGGSAAKVLVFSFDACLWGCLRTLCCAVGLPGGCS